MPDPRNPELSQQPRLRRHPRSAELDARVLDPTAAPTIQGLTHRPTVYVGRRLIVAKGPRLNDQVDILREVADALGWEANLTRESAKTKNLRVGVRTVEISARENTIDRAPDAWYLLQKARLHVKDDLERLSGVGLDHVVDTRPMLPDPF